MMFTFHFTRFEERSRHRPSAGTQRLSQCSEAISGARRRSGDPPLGDGAARAGRNGGRPAGGAGGAARGYTR